MQAKLSPTEERFVVQGAQQGVREDGRALLDLRHLDVKTGTIPQANGSARIRQPFTDAQVLCGVKIEVGEPSKDQPRRGLLEVSVDLSALAGANQDNFATDRYSAELSQSLQLTLERCGMLDAPSMCIIPGQYCWTIFVDFVVLGAAGNLGDLLSLAAFCALCDAAVPETTVIETEQGPDFEIVAQVGASQRIFTDDIPLSATLALVGGALVADPTLNEEECSSAVVSIHVKQRGQVCGVHMKRDGGVAPTQLLPMFQTARQIVHELFGLVKREMRQENKMQLQVEADPSLTFVRDEVTLTTAGTLALPKGAVAAGSGDSDNDSRHDVDML